jgi:uncharacterized membrane protein YkgB
VGLGRCELRDERIGGVHRTCQVTDECLSFLVTTPGVWAASAGGFPALSGSPGQFLIKDLALLGISLWSLGEAWKASERGVPVR